MSDTAIATSASPVAASQTQVEKNVATKKASSGLKAKKVAVPPSHPPTQQMVDASMKNLKERGGSSLMTIKKYIVATYNCDAQKLAPFIKKYLKTAVANGKLVQTKGKKSGAVKAKPTTAKAKGGPAKAKTPKPKIAIAKPKKAATASPPKKSVVKKPKTKK